MGLAIRPGSRLQTVRKPGGKYRSHVPCSILTFGIAASQRENNVHLLNTVTALAPSSGPGQVYHFPKPPEGSLMTSEFNLPQVHGHTVQYCNVAMGYGTWWATTAIT